MPTPKPMRIESLLLSPSSELGERATVSRDASTAQHSKAIPPLLLTTRKVDKVQIPRLERIIVGTSPGRRARITKACNNCRSRKIKCSGDAGRCEECHRGGVLCVYEQTRRDRLKHITEQNEMLMEVLKDLSLRVSDDERKRITLALERVGLNAY